MAGQVKTLFDLNPRGPIVAKHERAHEMFSLNRVKPDFSRDLEGHAPNQDFAIECNRLLTRFSVERYSNGRNRQGDSRSLEF